MVYICGVVEGFYGTPWRCSERKDLFLKLNELGLNTYMYAPKDDAKHRKNWRDFYTDVEIDVLKSLISCCEEHNVNFVYSISPGLDIVFSSETDVTALKQKLKQVYDAGCRSFALLFDDIDPELCLADKLEFTSSADAQVKITNKLYEWFESLESVLFCPTEYCTTRAKPDIESSEYLATLGTGLHENIHVLWTGPKVISKTIDCTSLQELTKVLKRKPLIWDNIHANDYDHRRVFLGPFKGRPVELYENTAGILTNPNCEYECNHIAIHSLSTWLKHAENVCGSTENHKLKGLADVYYNSDNALLEAVENWMCTFNLLKNTIQDSRMQNSSEKLALGLNINSLLNEDFSKNNKSDTLNGGNKNIEESVENNDSPKNDKINLLEVKDPAENHDSDTSPKKKAKSSKITIEDVLLLCDLFHLPYEHGEGGKRIIAEFKWLKENAIDYNESNDQLRIDHWIIRSNVFKDLCRRVEVMFDRLQDIPNRRLLQQLYPYVYDVKEAVMHLSSFVKWLGSREREKQQSFLPKDSESWFYRGGIVGEIERLLPRPDTDETARENSSNTSAQITTIRPYLPQDKEMLYNLCNSFTPESKNYEIESLSGDSMIGIFLEFSPELTLVAEINNEICGFIVAHKNCKELNDKIDQDWIPKMKSKYPLSSLVPSSWSVQDKAINRLHHFNFITPDSVSKHYNAVLRMELNEKVKNGIAQRMLQCCTAQMKTNAYCELTVAQDRIEHMFYEAASFQPIKLQHLHTTGNVFYGYKYE